MALRKYKKIISFLVLLLFLASCNDKEEIIFKGGWVIALCGISNDCSSTDDEFTAKWGYFGSQIQCDSAVTIWKERGVKYGNPNCVPCEYIYYDKQMESFECK